MDGKKAMKMFEDNLIFDEELQREEYPRLAKWRERIFANAPIRKAEEGYPHLEGFLMRQATRGG